MAWLINGECDIPTSQEFKEFLKQNVGPINASVAEEAKRHFEKQDIIRTSPLLKEVLDTFISRVVQFPPFALPGNDSFHLNDAVVRDTQAGASDGAEEMETVVKKSRKRVCFFLKTLY